jgi:hypothetical protein
MKIRSGLVILCFLLGFGVDILGGDKGPVFDDAYYAEHDRQVVDSLREKLKQEGGEDYQSLSEEQRGRALQDHIDGYIRGNQAERLLVEIRNKPRTFFGRVVDEQGKNVENATVTMSVEQEKMLGKKFLIKQTLHHRYTMTTDEQGAFVISDAVGWRFTLKDIKADGYLFDSTKQPSLYFFPVTHASNLKGKYFFRENKKFSVTFVLIKESHFAPSLEVNDTSTGR